jgi:hypothetical protein
MISASASSPSLILQNLARLTEIKIKDSIKNIMESMGFHRQDNWRVKSLSTMDLKKIRDEFNSRYIFYFLFIYNHNKYASNCWAFVEYASKRLGYPY